MAAYNHCYLMLLVMLSLFSCATSLEINGAEFATRLTEISEDGLGQSKIQELFNDNAHFTITTSSGHEIVRKLAASVGKRFMNYNNAVRELHKQFDKRPVNLTTPEVNIDITECCKVKPKDNLDTWCYRHHSGSAGPVAYHKDILETMKETSKEIPNIGWQYYGNEEGLLLHYPSQHAKSCTEYDHRLRFWYAEASSPVAKDIVIATESTEKTNTIIRSAVDTLLNSINPNDRITVAKFGSVVNLYLGSSEQSTCFSQYLALGTPQNIRIFKGFMDSTENNNAGPVNLRQVIDTAFDYFNKSGDATERRKLLVIFVASDPTDVKEHSEIIRKITVLNGGLQRKVVIQTYAFGSNISNYTKAILQNIAESTTGTFTYIEHGKHLRLQLHSYYSIFADSAEDRPPSVTVPYYDFFNLGLVISFCLPLHRGDKLEGVTCVDAKLEDIFFNVTYYHQGIDAYAFIIDSRGRTMLHPLLPKPTEVSEDTKFINILSLERDEGVQEIIESMKSGGNGSRRIPASRRKPKLGVVADFPGSQHSVSEYYWTKVPETDYSLCMVFTNRDREVEMEPKSDELNPVVNYIHPYTLIHGDNVLQSRCLHDGQVATTDGSVVMFSGAAYKLLFVGVNWEDSEQRQKYDNFFKASANDQAPEFKESTKHWVRLSGLVDTIWKEEPSTKYNSYIVWRHLVTASGVIRIYPGVNYTQYNPNSFSWYKEAILGEGRIHVDPVESGNSFTVMISQAVKESSPVAVPVAVVGGEIRPTILYHILEEVYPVCKAARCFIVDGNGYILAHQRYHHKEVHPSHIIAMEPAIADYLIKNGHLVEASCLDFLSQYRTLFNWKMAIKGWYVSSASPKFELHPAQGTNVFVGITWDNDADSCNCQNRTKCIVNKQRICKCPCFETLKFNLCNNTLPERGNNGPSACSILKKKFDVIQTNSNISQLGRCFKSPCDGFRMESDCAEKNGCQWCILEGEKEHSCHDQFYCGSAVSPTVGGNGMPVAVPIILSLLVLIIIIVFCCIVKYFPGIREKLCVKKNLQRDQERATPSGRHSPVYTSMEGLQANKTMGLDDSGMASVDTNDKSNISVVTIPNPEVHAYPPVPKRHPLQHAGSIASSDNTNLETQEQYKLSHPETSRPLQPEALDKSVDAQTQTGLRSLAEADDTPKLNESAEGTAEHIYINESADIAFSPHDGDSLSLRLSHLNSDGECITDINTESDDTDLEDNQGHSAFNVNSVENNGSRVTSRDSGVISEVSRQGNSQTYPKSP